MRYPRIESGKFNKLHVNNEADPVLNTRDFISVSI